MLRQVKKKSQGATGHRFAIVASQYNAHYVDAMLRDAKKALSDAGAREVKVVRVPGAFEIPVVAATLASLGNPPFAAILCLGVILRGETTHAQHIGHAVSDALMQIQLQYRVPIIHEVLLLENEAQARARCLDSKHSRGLEAALTAARMANVMAVFR